MEKSGVSLSKLRDFENLPLYSAVRQLMANLIAAFLGHEQADGSDRADCCTMMLAMDRKNDCLARSR
jgi:hypothetical protein